MPQLIAPRAPSGPFGNVPEPMEGYWWETDFVVIPWINSNGHAHEFLRWLHGLEAKAKPVLFPTVINTRLARLLEKRGYHECLFWVGEPFNAYADGLVRFPA